MDENGNLLVGTPGLTSAGRATPSQGGNNHVPDTPPTAVTAQSAAAAAIQAAAVAKQIESLDKTLTDKIDSKIETLTKKLNEVEKKLEKDLESKIHRLQSVVKQKFEEAEAKFSKKGDTIVAEPESPLKRNPTMISRAPSMLPEAEKSMKSSTLISPVALA